MQQSDKRVSAGPSLISADLTIDGNLSCQGAIQVDGRINGDIEGQSLVIGQGAEVKGVVTAAEATVHGKMQGEIRAKTVRIMSTGEMMGDILHQSLAVEAGARIEGNLRRTDLQRAEQARPAQAQPVQPPTPVQPAPVQPAQVQPAAVPPVQAQPAPVQPAPVQPPASVPPVQAQPAQADQPAKKPKKAPKGNGQALPV
jgi:cytoskeletal protein CcmA (bactofilin family)